jgi:hypothetical protein
MAFVLDYYYFTLTYLTELLSVFVQQLLTVQLYYHVCHTPFECIKDDAILEEYALARRKETSL